MKYFLITYGCQMNKSDSERIASVLESLNYRSAPQINGADLIVVNMCSIRQSAVDRVYGLINKIRKNKKIKTILTGCILKKDKKKLANSFDLILDIKDLPKWPQLLSINKTRPRCKEYLEIKPKYSNKFSAFVPISNGCNNFCSYCVVPYARGPLICRPHQEIIKEAKKFTRSGFKEIWLLGQNVNDYKSKNIRFPDLLKTINDIPGYFWIRFTSPHPKDFSDKLIKTMAECKKITPYLNLPVQSGDNQILKKMNRPYTVAQYKRLVKKIRKAIPNISLSTDVIVGFPGETKKQFQNTLSLFKEIKFDMAYIAKYSPRSQTAALKLKNHIPHSEKQKRYKAITEVVRQAALENNKKYVGKTVDALITESKDKFLIGKTDAYKTIKIIGPKKLVGNFIKAKIEDVSPWGLKGILIS